MKVSVCLKTANCMYLKGGLHSICSKCLCVHMYAYCIIYGAPNTPICMANSIYKDYKTCVRLSIETHRRRYCVACAHTYIGIQYCWLLCVPLSIPIIHRARYIKTCVAVHTRLCVGIAINKGTGSCKGIMYFFIGSSTKYIHTKCIHLHITVGPLRVFCLTLGLSMYLGRRTLCTL